ncbi:hypothetical protein BV25DRAFT_1922405 [Artomyces pyxidatus]|uniref:Uncharacterized protein n=1 Tax=Artomyces pyxidatus TaxID=48021 RepID=A0ACB8SFP3_9AGAM|nr:hypothetical protein BV25DRAFT_1922405 [Artomyces pyxidatus]
MSVFKLAQAFDLIGSRARPPFMDVPRTINSATPRAPAPWPEPDSLPSSFKWAGDFYDKSDRRIQCLYLTDQDTPLRVWMVGMLDDVELEAMFDRPGYAWTIMRPLFKGSLHAANALLDHFTHPDDTADFEWHDPDDAIHASYSTDTHPDNLSFISTDKDTADRDALFPVNHLFDAQDVENPLHSRNTVSDRAFTYRVVVLQECLLTRVSRHWGDPGFTPYFVLRNVYKLSP